MKESDFKMTICPIAIGIGCRKCPIVKICPLKEIIGDYDRSKSQENSPEPPASGEKKE